MELERVQEATAKKEQQNIKTFGKLELEKKINDAKDQSIEFIEFADEIWTLEALISYARDLDNSDELKEQDHATQSTDIDMEDCSICDEVDQTAAMRSTVKRKATHHDSSLESKRVRKESTGNATLKDTKLGTGYKPGFFTQLSFEEQQTFEDETAFSTYQVSVKKRKRDARKQHDSELRMANIKRKAETAAAAASAAAEAALKSGNTVTEDSPESSLFGEVLKSAAEGSSDAMITTNADHICEDDQSNAATQEGVMIRMPDATKKRYPTGFVSTYRGLIPYTRWISSKFWSGRSNIFTKQQKDRIKELSKSHPRYLYHVHSRYGRRHTQGSIDEERMNPAAAVEGKTIYPSIYDFPTLSELVENFGRRILWERRYTDQFSSYTTSLLFAFVHALGRKIKGETEITISCLDTNQVKTTDGGDVEFYHVPDLQRILRVSDWKFWLPQHYYKLIAPWYSHEYVVHGSIKLGDVPFRMVPLEEFERAGLYDFLPGLHDDNASSDMTRLYSRCVEMRMYWYSWAVPAPFIIHHLDHASTLARLFTPQDHFTSDKSSLVRPVHFQIFVDFVGLSRRKGKRAVFKEYIRNHFTVANIRDVLHPALHIIPNNLPESMQALLRIRQACASLSMPRLPATQVVCVDNDFDFQGRCSRDFLDKFPNLKPVKKPRPPKTILARPQSSRFQAAITANGSDHIESDTSVRAAEESVATEGVEQSEPQSGKNVEDDKIAGEEETGMSTTPALMMAMV